MAKKVVAIIKLALPAGKATPAPPVDPHLGNMEQILRHFVRNIMPKPQIKET